MAHNRDEWKRVESGIWKHKSKAKTYWVEARYLDSKYKDSDTVVGTIADARDRRQSLLSGLKKRSLKSPGQYQSTWKALGFYVHKKYSKSSQYRIGSGRAIMRLWLDRIGKAAPEDLTSADINKVIHRMKESGYKDTGIIPYVSRLHTALDYCASEGRITLRADLWDGIEKLKNDIPIKKLVDDSVWIDIMSAMPEWARFVMLYKLMVPCRLLELFEAKTDSIDLEKRYFVLEEQTTKGKRMREMPIPADLESRFRAIKESGRQFIFMREHIDGSATKLSRNSLSVAFAEVRDEKNLNRDIKVRMLRHTAVSKWMEECSEKVVSEVAGATPETLKSYYQLVPLSSKVSAADKVARIHGLGMDTLDKILPFRVKSEVASV